MTANEAPARQKKGAVRFYQRWNRAPATLVDRLRGLIRDGVAERTRASRLRTATLDFDNDGVA